MDAAQPENAVELVCLYFEDLTSNCGVKLWISSHWEQAVAKKIWNVFETRRSLVQML